jgi:predicted PurR-regulated permease PerM
MRAQWPDWSTQRRSRLLLLIVVNALVLLTLWIARGALLPYLLALVLGYLMLPLVNWLERVFAERARVRHGSRPLAIVLTYVVTAAVIALFISMVVPILIDQFQSLWDNRANIILRLEALNEQGLAWYREHVPQQMQEQIDEGVQRASENLAAAVQAGATHTFLAITSTISFLLGTLVIPFWLFYLLNDQKKALRALRLLVPDRYWVDVRNVIRLIDNVLASYIRGQLVLSLSIGVMATVGLMLLGVNYAVVLGVVAGLFEFLPFIGPILGAIPAVIVATVQEPILGLWTALFFLAIQQLENLLLVPRISGTAVRLHPTIIMLVLVIGNEVGGLLAMLVAVPLTAVLRDVFRYLWLRLQDQPVTADEAMMRIRGPSVDTPSV